jgi:hypothetical protein
MLKGGNAHADETPVMTGSSQRPNTTFRFQFPMLNSQPFERLNNSWAVEGSRLSVERSGVSSAAVLVFLAAAAGTRLVAANFRHITTNGRRGFFDGFFNDVFASGGTWRFSPWWSWGLTQG